MRSLLLNAHYLKDLLSLFNEGFNNIEYLKDIKSLIGKKLLYCRITNDNFIMLKFEDVQVIIVIDTFNRENKVLYDNVKPQTLKDILLKDGIFSIQLEDDVLSHNFNRNYTIRIEHSFIISKSNEPEDKLLNKLIDLVIKYDYNSECIDKVIRDKIFTISSAYLYALNKGFNVSEYQLDISILKGKTITKIEGMKNESEAVAIYTEDLVFVMYHAEECCESVNLVDCEFNEEDFKGAYVNDAYCNIEYKNYGDDGDECFTFYNINTNKGYLNLRWYGESNGYYSVKAFSEVLMKGEVKDHNELEDILHAI